MNVLQILPELHVGGVETGVVDFAEYLVNHGHQSIVISNGGELVSELERKGSKHYQLPVHKKSLWTILKMVKAVRKIIEQERIDIVHARSRIPAWIAYFASRKTKAVFLTTCHGYYKNKFFSQVMGWPKMVIVPSQAIARHMIDDFKVSSEHIRCIPRGVNLERFSIQREDTPGKSSFVIANIGRLTPLKGHIFFLKAMAKIVRTMPYVKIWVIGDAPASKESYKQELLLLTKRLGLENYVEFLGNRRDIPQLLAKTDVLVFSSIEPESFGRVILEAQAIGVPVVANQVGGVVDIIDHEKTGILVLAKDIDSMAYEVMRVLKDKELSQRLVQQAQTKLKEQFSLEQMASQTIEVYEELLRMMNILVIKISSIGDVVLVTASLRALRQKFPQAKIVCLVGKDSRRVLHNCPYIDELMIYDSKRKDRGLWRFLRFASYVRSYKFDKVIDFQNNRQSHLLAFLSMPKESYGYDNNKWGFLLSSRIKNDNPSMDPVSHQFQVLKMLGVEKESDSYLELWPSDNDKLYVKSLLDSEWLTNVQNVIGINIAASDKWQTKNWPIEYIARLCDILSGKNIRVLITGIEKDKKRAQYLLSLTKSKPTIMIGKTDILQLAALVKRCKVYVTPDSAPLHVAAAMQTPFVVFFGPTSSKRHLPPAKKYVVLERELTCSPCYSPRCKILTHVCMKEISPEQVAEKIQSLMGE